MASVPVGIALGSNLGNRKAELKAAISFLRDLAIDGQVRESPRIETEPVGCPPNSPKFLNSVAEIRVDTVDMPPLHLLTYLHEFEMERGRPPMHGVNASRTIDLDIIYYGVEQIDTMGLIIPHPRATKRRFVLEPLSHLHPDLILPGQTKTVKQLLSEL